MVSITFREVSGRTRTVRGEERRGKARKKIIVKGKSEVEDEEQEGEVRGKGGREGVRQ